MLDTNIAHRRHKQLRLSEKKDDDDDDSLFGNSNHTWQKGNKLK